MSRVDDCNSLPSIDLLDRGGILQQPTIPRGPEHLPSVREKPKEVMKIDRDQIVVKSYAGGLVKSFEIRTK